MDLLLRTATVNDFDDYYKHKCESTDIYWNGFEKEPQYEGLKKVFLTRINNDSSKIIKILEKEGKYIGYLQYTFGNGEVEIGIGICNECQGKGYGKEALELAVNDIPSSLQIFSRIRDDNQASQQCFEKAGFTRSNKYTMEPFYPKPDKIKLRRYDWVR